MGLVNALSSFGVCLTVLHSGPSGKGENATEFVHFPAFSHIPGMQNYTHPLNFFFPRTLSDLLRRGKFDAIQCEQPWSMFPTTLIANGYGIPVVFDTHNVELRWSIEASRFPILVPYVYVAEGLALGQARLILAVSETDKLALMNRYGTPPEKIHVSPNGVDVARFQNVSPDPILRARLLIGNRKLVLFHGSLHGRPNEEAAELILTRIAPAVSQATFVIAGVGPSRSLVERSKRTRNVIVLGFVPQIERLIASADICVAPVVRGSGTRLKLLEYMAAGKPIVATYMAAEGIPLRNELDALLLREVGERFVLAVKRLVLDQKLCDELGSNAKKLAATYDWRVIGQDLYNAYVKLVD